MLIPTELIPEEIAHFATTSPCGPICTAQERKELYAVMEEAYKGRTYTIRRSALQYYRYQKKMPTKQLMEISLHACARSLERYLTTNIRKFE